MPIDVSVAHSVPGRTRLRVSGLKRNAGCAEGLGALLRSQAGVSDVRVNAACESVVVGHDATVQTPESVLSLISGSSFQELQERASGARPRPSDDEGIPIELVLSSGCLALGLILGPLGYLIIPLLVARSAAPMFVRAWRSVRLNGKLNVDVLDVAATGLLLFQSQMSTAVLLIWLVNLADYIRDKTTERSRQAIGDILNERARPAWVLRSGKKVQVPAQEILSGEMVFVYPGERIPVDGKVRTGKATVDQSALSGESMPVEKGPGDQVYTATVVRAGKLQIKAEKVGQDTEVARIVRLVDEAPIRDTRMQNYAETLADNLVPASFLLAGMAGFATKSVARAASILIVDYGTGIRVAAPTSVLSSITRAARRGIYIKGGRHLEKLAEVDAIVFDKTGTLTTGSAEVMEVVASNGHFDKDQVLALAASAEQRLSHPVAQAIVRAAEKQRLDIPSRSTSEYSIGLGVEARVNGYTLLVGNRRFLLARGLELPESYAQRVDSMEERLLAPVCVVVNGEPAGVIGVADRLRPESREIMMALKERGIAEVIILTGDHQRIADQVGKTLGVSRVYANVFPADKADIVKSIQAEGRTVCVVGDGINDSPALAQADVGISVYGGTDVAEETAHVSLLRGDLWKIPLAIDIAREGMALIHQNWRIISIPGTIVLGMAFLGAIGPVMTTILSNGSAILATMNGLRPLANNTTTEELAAAHRKRLR